MKDAPNHVGRDHNRNNNGGRYAYVTLFSHDSYLPGVLALQRSAVRVGLRYPLIVMTTQSVSQTAADAIRREGCEIRMATPFKPDGVDHSQYVRALYAECWNKLRMWEWEEFDRLVYLDADMVMRRNIDHLFELPDNAALYAVGDCYGGRETAEERNACCHFRPDTTPQYFNAGFYVMRPNKKELVQMEAALATGSVAVGRFAEQDFLNGYFTGSWIHLPYTYNAQKRIKFHHTDLWCLEDVHVIHFVDEKPWSHPYSEENKAYAEIVEFWWEVYTCSHPPCEKEGCSSSLPTSISTGLNVAGPRPHVASEPVIDFIPAS